MKKIFVAVFVLFICIAFAGASFAATAKKVATDNPENAKQGFTPDKSKTMGNGADKVKAKGGKAGLKTQGDDVSLKKGGKTTGTVK